MKDKVIIFVSDDNYIAHVKSLTVNCCRQGGYCGSFAVICPKGSKAAGEFKALGYDVLEVDALSFMQKFFVFDPFFKQWKKALYLDCDILIQDNLERLFALLDKEDKIWMDTEDGTTLESFWRDEKAAEHPEVYQWMKDNYPVVNKQTFNTAFILFKPSLIADGVPQKLIEIQQKAEPANRLENGGTDQQIINLLLWNEGKKIPDKLVCFWGLAEPQNDVDSEYRMFKKGDTPVAVHFTRWYAPWLAKAPNADAYLNRHLNRPVNEVYVENLNNFKHL